MKRLLAFVLLSLSILEVCAAPNAGFGLDAFNRAVSAATRGNVVFSPFSFEIDSVVFSEAVDALSRAKLAETMGVLNGLESVYRPLHEELTVSGSSHFTFLDARGFSLPDERKTNPTYRQWLQKTFCAEAFTASFRKGAEAWFRARLDGTMEDFSFEQDISSGTSYSYYDLVYACFPWQDPFPTNNTREISFNANAANAITLKAICDLRIADVWKRKNYSALRLPLSKDSYFFALLPNKDVEVRDIRGELSSKTISDFICGFKSVTELGISHGPVAIVIPKMDITSEVDLKLPFEYFRFPTKGMERMQKEIKPQILRQRIRFQFDERGPDGQLIAEKPLDKIVNSTDDTIRFILNRPFLFFVYHEPTVTIPIVGQFMGR